MSPEQLSGRDADARSDIFAFGAVLYEMATGRRAFDGRTSATVVGAVLPHGSAARLLRSAARAAGVGSSRLAVPGERPRRSLADRARSDAGAEVGCRARAGRCGAANLRADRGTRILGVSVAFAVLAVAAALFSVAYVRRPSVDSPLVQLSFVPPDGSTLGRLWNRRPADDFARWPEAGVRRNSR